MHVYGVLVANGSVKERLIMIMARVLENGEEKKITTSKNGSRTGHSDIGTCLVEIKVTDIG